MAMSRKAEEMMRLAPSWSFLATAAAAKGMRLMVTGYTKDGGRLMRSMPKVYWPYRAVGVSGSSSAMEPSRPRTILLSMRVMMLMAELLRVMGMPMVSTFFISVPELSGTSRDSVRSLWVSR